MSESASSESSSLHMLSAACVDHNAKHEASESDFCRNLGDNNVWTLSGENVVQLNNLPANCDTNNLQEIVASFGMIHRMEKMEHQDSSSIRFQLSSRESCDWVEKPRN